MTAAQVLVSNVRRLMDSNNYNMADVSRRSGLTLRHVKFILDGERKPTIDTIEALAKAFDLAIW